MSFFEEKKYFIVFAVLAILTTFFATPLKSGLIGLQDFFQPNLSGVGKNISEFFSFAFDADLRKENSLLQEKTRQLLAQNSRCQDITRENEDLRDALGMGLEKKYNLISARLIGKNAMQDKISINKGELDGVVEGMAAITADQVLVGKVSKVYKNFSEIDLLSNPKNIFNAKVYGKDINVVLKGKGDFRISLEFLSQNSAIEPGDDLITIALGGAFPEGFVVGKILSIEKKDIDPMPTIEVAPALNPADLDNLFLISYKSTE